MTISKVVSKEEAAQAAAELREAGRKVVFTNGCFDILHLGHVRYLQEARALGDMLVVGLNSDSSVKRLGKGEDRPINPEGQRAEVLAALEAVDLVVLFEEDTPAELVRSVQPDILVKGGDWPLDKIVGSDFVLARGGRVESLQLTPGLSTTGLVARIRGMAR